MFSISRMKRLIATIFGLMLVLGAAQVGAGVSSAHAMPDMAAVSAPCQMSDCAGSGHAAMPATVCLEYCFSAALGAREVAPILPLLFATVLVVLAISVLGVVPRDTRTPGPNVSDALSRLLLRQKLATVILRN